jgi:hypothetical protein
MSDFHSSTEDDAHIERLHEAEHALLCQAFGGQLPSLQKEYMQRYINGEISRIEAFEQLSHS